MVPWYVYHARYHLVYHGVHGMHGSMAIPRYHGTHVYHGTSEYHGTLGTMVHVYHTIGVVVIVSHLDHQWYQTGHVYVYVHVLPNWYHTMVLVPWYTCTNGTFLR